MEDSSLATLCCEDVAAVERFILIATAATSRATPAAPTPPVMPALNAEFELEVPLVAPWVDSLLLSRVASDSVAPTPRSKGHAGELFIERSNWPMENGAIDSGAIDNGDNENGAIENGAIENGAMEKSTCVAEVYSKSWR